MAVRGLVGSASPPQWDASPGPGQEAMLSSPGAVVFPLVCWGVWGSRRPEQSSGQCRGLRTLGFHSRSLSAAAGGLSSLQPAPSWSRTEPGLPWGSPFSEEVPREGQALEKQLFRAPLFPRPLEDQSYQNSGGDNSQNSTLTQSFWETFGSTDPAAAHRSPSSDSWTCADASAEKRSSDSWDVWGSGSTSNHKNSDNSDGGEAWGGGGEGRPKVTRKAAPKAAQVDEGWDNHNW